jgi:uncharacterized membrane protein
MLDSLKDDPKTYIILILALMLGILGLEVGALYITAITKHEEEGWHIISALVGGFFLVVLFFLIVDVIVHVSKLKTKHDWKEEREEAIEKERYKMETARIEVMLEKLKGHEELEPAELEHLKRIEDIELNQGEPSG